MSSQSLIYPFEHPPAPGELVNICEGLYWLRMPIPFQLNHINLWLVEGLDGWSIVDTGVQSDDTKNTG